MRLGKESVILVGGGGHGKVVVDAIKNSDEFIVYGIVDLKLPKGTSVLGVRVVGTDKLLPQIFKNGIKKAFISIASIGNCDIRKKIYANLKGIGFELSVIIHPKAIVAEDAEIGEGTFVAAGAVLNPGVKIGKNVIVNTSSSVDHDCRIGDFVHIAPGVTLCGAVRVGEATHIGTGANVVQCLDIGKNCMIKAGTLVRRSVCDGQVVGLGVVDQCDRTAW